MPPNPLKNAWLVLALKRWVLGIRFRVTPFRLAFQRAHLNSFVTVFLPALKARLVRYRRAPARPPPSTPMDASPFPPQTDENIAPPVRKYMFAPSDVPPTRPTMFDYPASEEPTAMVSHAGDETGSFILTKAVLEAYVAHTQRGDPVYHARMLPDEYLPEALKDARAAGREANNGTVSSSSPSDSCCLLNQRAPGPAPYLELRGMDDSSSWSSISSEVGLASPLVWVRQASLDSDRLPVVLPTYAPSETLSSSFYSDNSQDLSSDSNASLNHPASSPTAHLVPPHRYGAGSSDSGDVDLLLAIIWGTTEQTSPRNSG